MEHSYKDFPENISKLVYSIHPRKGMVCVAGFKYYSLKDLNNIPLDTRLSFPHDLFVAIHSAGSAGKNRIAISEKGQAMKAFTVKSHYARNNEVKLVRYMTLTEAKALRSGDHVLVLTDKGKWANAKVNGAPKVWKRSPLKCRIPLKYGMYEYFYADFDENTSETCLLVEM